MKKPKIMLHIIMPNQVSGPNMSSYTIANSYLRNSYEFVFLIQDKQAGGRINVPLIIGLANQIKKSKPDILHISGLQSSGFHAVIACLLARKRNILLTVHGSSIDAISLSAFKRFVFGNIIEPITLKLSKNVLTVCEAMKNRDFIQKYSNNLIGHIHNAAPIIGVDIKGFNLKEKYDIKNKIIVAIVGRIIFDKGVTFIADAIKEIKRDELVFMFIGDGPEEEKLKDFLSYEVENKSVIFMGKQSEVIPILKECDIFLFATLHENLSNALLEACTVGLAIIATNVGGNPEVITNMENGILIPSKDVSSIIDSILYLADNEDVRNNLGLKAKQNMVDNFSQKKILHELDGVYKRMLNYECEV